MSQISNIVIWTRRLATCAAVGLISACVSQTESNAASDVAQPSAAMGLRYAQQNCASCHAVASGQHQSPNRNAPSFAVIANLPGMTGTALNAWLHSPHPTMPNLIVSPADRDNITAYLQSLRRGGGQA
jgi:mono/diheme cytochrome c family protein